MTPRGMRRLAPVLAAAAALSAMPPCRSGGEIVGGAPEPKGLIFNQRPTRAINVRSPKGATVQREAVLAAATAGSEMR